VRQHENKLKILLKKSKRIRQDYFVHSFFQREGNFQKYAVDLLTINSNKKSLEMIDFETISFLVNKKYNQNDVSEIPFSLSCSIRKWNFFLIK
jgi:hypothetical protein